MEITSRIELPLLLKHFNLPLIGCELGVAQASNSIDLLKNGLEFIYCIDSWKQLEQHGDGSYPQEWHEDNYTMTINNLRPYKDRYKIIRGLSYEVANQIPDGSLGLVYVDSDHSYEACKKDIEAYYSKLVPNGIMSFHDFYNEGYGVRKAVEEFADFKKLKINKITEHSGDDSHASVWIQI